MTRRRVDGHSDGVEVATMSPHVRVKRLNTAESCTEVVHRNVEAAVIVIYPSVWRRASHLHAHIRQPGSLIAKVCEERGHEATQLGIDHAIFDLSASTRQIAVGIRVTC